MPSRQECIDAAGRRLAEADAIAATLTVSELARRAYTPTGPSLAELEDLIRAHRASMTPVPSTSQDAATAPDTSRRTA